MKYQLIRAGLEGFWFSGAHVMARPMLGGLGAIFTLHRVHPEPHDPFSPNRILDVTPDFLDRVVGHVRRRGLDIVDLDEALRRIAEPDPARRFVVFTFDDGYRDNAEHALPVMRRHGAPFTIYVASAFSDGRGELWWLALEEIIRREKRVEIDVAGTRFDIDTATLPGKIAAWRVLYGALRACGEPEQREAIRGLAQRTGYDLHARCRDLIMPWDDVRAIAQDPLVTIGAHTVDHPAIAKLAPAEALDQMRRSADAIAAHIGVRPRHFSFPYGSKDAAGPRDFALAAEAGFATAVTTRPGLLYPEHAGHPTALPRVSLNGLFQSVRHVDVLLSGLPTFVMNRMARLSVA